MDLAGRACLCGKDHSIMSPEGFMYVLLCKRRARRKRRGPGEAPRRPSLVILPGAESMTRRRAPTTTESDHTVPGDSDILSACSYYIFFVWPDAIRLPSAPAGLASRSFCHASSHVSAARRTSSTRHCSRIKADAVRTLRPGVSRWPGVLWPIFAFKGLDKPGTVRHQVMA